MVWAGGALDQALVEAQAGFHVFQELGRDTIGLCVL
jgi:hypothetical protein